jgi:hypothetical protein
VGSNRIVMLTIIEIGYEINIIDMTEGCSYASIADLGPIVYYPEHMDQLSLIGRLFHAPCCT